MIDITQLATRIFNLSGFQRIFEPLLKLSIQEQFFEVKNQNEDIDLPYLLSCASILADSNLPEHLDVAYRIAQFGIQQKNDDELAIKAALILEKMTNHPSIELAISKGYIEKNYIDQLPLLSKLDIIRRNIKYSLWDETENKLININKFQYDVLEKNYDSQILSISAPTSAGKSYILLNIIKETLLNKAQTTMVYVVPTRALISQVEVDIRKKLKTPEFHDVFITSMPIMDELLEEYTKRIFILTQERLQWLINEKRDFYIDFLIVDEAQKVNDGSRGVILQNVIEDLIYENKDIKVIFSSPLTDNPEVFLQPLYEISSMNTVQKEFVPVNQNLMWVNPVFRKPREWELKLCYKNGTYDIGKIKLENKPNNTIERLIYIVSSLGNISGGNLVYTKIPSDAEKAAEKLYEILPEEEVIDLELIELKNLIQEVISTRYSLCKLITKGVAYHYGNMPLIIKSEIERLFKAGKIKYLMCTSTLVEGVNLPAKTIFIRTPKKGNTTPLSEIEFWNLAGRAGRQGLEFQGNIVCIDTEDTSVWENPPASRKKYKIEFYSKKVIKEKFDEIIEYILIDAFEEELYNIDYEHTISYLLKIFNKDQYIIDKSLSSLINESQIEVLENSLKTMMKNIDIPEEILFKHSGISPLAQQKLKNFFQKNLDKLDMLEPINPTLPHAPDRYEHIIRLIQSVIPFDHENRARYLAFLVTDWMKGMPLNYLISKSQQYWDKSGEKNSQRVIRNTFKDIEEFARFKFIKYGSCYKDILNLVREQNSLEIIDDSEMLKIWLELGASNKTVISLIGIGFNRSTALVIAQQIDSEHLNRNEVINYLLKIDTNGLNKIMKRELAQVIDFYFVEESV